jgi:hypothetical protein
MWLAKDCALYRDQVLQKENPLRNVVGTVPAVCECIPLLAHCTHIVRPCGVPLPRLPLPSYLQHRSAHLGCGMDYMTLWQKLESLLSRIKPRIVMFPALFMTRFPQLHCYQAPNPKSVFPGSIPSHPNRPSWRMLGVIVFESCVVPARVFGVPVWSGSGCRVR